MLPALPAIEKAIATLRSVAAALPELPLSFDLADLRGYHYHNGLVFAAYHPGNASAVALGGRYDGAGAAFGRARPATGFSMDLRLVAQLVGGDEGAGAIVAPAGAMPPSRRKSLACVPTGEIVIELLPGEGIPEGPRCTHAGSSPAAANGQSNRFDQGYRGYGKRTSWSSAPSGATKAKNKIVDWLTDSAQGVVRFQGGHNAGHTLVVGQGAESVSSSIWCRRASSARAYSATSATASCSTSIT